MGRGVQGGQEYLLQRAGVNQRNRNPSLACGFAVSATPPWSGSEGASVGLLIGRGNREVRSISYKE